MPRRRAVRLRQVVVRRFPLATHGGRSGFEGAPTARRDRAAGGRLGDRLASRRHLRTSRRFRGRAARDDRSEEHTSELQSLMRISYAVFCLKKKTSTSPKTTTQQRETVNQL